MLWFNCKFLKKAYGKIINESESKRNNISKLCICLRLEDNGKEPERKQSQKSYQVKLLSELAFDALSKAMKKTDLTI